MGLFFVGMARAAGLAGTRLLAGHAHGRQPGTLTGMVQVHGQHAQPAVPGAAGCSAFGSFTAAHGFAVNLFAVIALAAIGAGLAERAARGCCGPRSPSSLMVLCLADWVLIEDFGLFRRPRHRPEQHDPDGPGGGRRLPGLSPTCRRSRAATPPSGRQAVARPAAGTVAPGMRRDRTRRLARTQLRPAPPDRGRRARQPADAAGHRPTWAVAIIVVGAVPMAMAPGQRAAPTRSSRRRSTATRPAGLHGPGLHADRPARPRGQPGQPARQGGAAHLPRPGVHQRLPVDRAGVPRRPTRCSARQPGTSSWSRSSPTRSTTPSRYTRAFDRQENLDHVAELALPDRQRRPAAAGVAALPDHGPDPAGGRDDRAQRRRLRHRSRPGRPGRNSISTRDRAPPALVSSFAAELTSAASRL